MKKTTLLLAACCIIASAYCQKDKEKEKEKQLASIAEIPCKCIDSINVYDKTKAEVAQQINRCIGTSVAMHQISAKIADIDLKKVITTSTDGKNKVDINVDLNESSGEYKKYYYEIERYLMANCKAIKAKIAANDKQRESSLSDNPEAMAYYTKGIKESEKENFKKAIDNFKKALKIDSNFAFAWDNLGLCYRKTDDYDQAISAYKKSLAIDPYGAMPLQNIAVVYQFKKEYQNAIEAYQRLSSLDQNNPEIYYGIGQIYTLYLNDMEKALRNMCKAYNLYIEQKSPYRTDAEKIINAIYVKMKQEGNESLFNSILQENNISTGK